MDFLWYLMLLKLCFSLMPLLWTCIFACFIVRHELNEGEMKYWMNTAVPALSHRQLYTEPFLKEGDTGVTGNLGRTRRIVFYKFNAPAQPFPKHWRCRTGRRECICGTHAQEEQQSGRELTLTLLPRGEASRNFGSDYFVLHVLAKQGGPVPSYRCTNELR